MLLRDGDGGGGGEAEWVMLFMKCTRNKCVSDCRKCKKCVKTDHIPLCGEYRLVVK